MRICVCHACHAWHGCDQIHKQLYVVGRVFAIALVSIWKQQYANKEGIHFTATRAASL